MIDNWRIWKKKLCSFQYNQVLAQEEMLWFQKSREQWVRYGNKNTKFFHTQTIIGLRRNKITGLDIGGIWCIDEEVLETEVVTFFKKTLSE